MTYEKVAENLAHVRGQISEACRAAGRDPAEVTLVAVSKRHPAQAVAHAFDAGQRVFGENYARELQEKQTELAARAELRWHFIGRVQASNSNVISSCDLVHGVGSLHQAQALGKAALKREKSVVVLLQVNLEEEDTKNGFTGEGLARELPVLQQIAGLRLAGLMSMPRSIEVRRAFAGVRVLRDRLRAQGGLELKELSMGMSGDFHEAVLEGATLVRVGTAIFGARPERTEAV